MIARTLVSACAAWALALPAQTYAPKGKPGPFQVEVERGVWTDAARQNREVPWKLYLPRGEAGPLPVVVFSHGLGGSREGAQYLGSHLASHGYAAFHIQHPGSDIGVVRQGGLQQALRTVPGDAAAALDRFRDVPFAVDRIEEMSREGRFAGRFDSARMGISGHSYGAITTLIAAGQQGAAGGHALAERRFRAAIAYSPSPPRRGSAEAAFREMLMPIFHITGTADGDPLGTFQPEDRQKPFRLISNVEQYLLVLTDAVHMTFSGRLGANYPKIDRHHELVKIASTAFWDAYLRDDAEALGWLRDGGFAAELAGDGTFEHKPAANSRPR